MENLSIGIGTEGYGTNLPMPTPETAVVPAVPSEEMAAMATPRICEVAPIELDDVLMTAVNRAFRDRGQKIDRDDMQHIVDSLGQAAVRTCPNIRMGEIPMAIFDGVFGEYGDYFGLNVHTFVSFLKARYLSRKRAESARAILPKPPEKKPPSEEEICRMDRELLVRAFERWKRTGRYEDYGSYIYRVAANKLNLLHLSEERKEEYLSRGTERARLHAMAPRRHTDRKTVERDAADVRPMAYREARQMALNDWFADLAEKGTDMARLLEMDEKNKRHGN